jgi:hypothetical protein
VEARSAKRAELGDGSRWDDLAAQADIAAGIVRARLDSGRSPGPVQVFPWPKDRKGFRHMAWMDPFDRVAYRAMVGRLIPAIEASLDRGVVLSSRLKYRPPGWELDGWRDAI